MSPPASVGLYHQRVQIDRLFFSSLSYLWQINKLKLKIGDAFHLHLVTLLSYF